MLAKVKKTINFWKIFNLSLSGKITIVKTLIYPILNYYLSVLPVSDQWLAELSNIIENFILQGMNLSVEKLYQSPRMGGLGMFKPTLFFKSLTCTWIKRCNALTHDNWRRVLLDSSGDDGISYIQNSDVEGLGPILTNMVSNFVIFRNSFGTIRNNFLLTPVLNNSFFSLRKTASGKHWMMNFLTIFYPTTARDEGLSDSVKCRAIPAA
jgi:hypothetical protein